MLKHVFALLFFFSCSDTTRVHNFTGRSGANANKFEKFPVLHPCRQEVYDYNYANEVS